MNAVPVPPQRSAQGGFALITVLLLLFVIAATVVAATVLGSNQLLISRHHSRATTLERAAEAGLEQARARLNGDKGLYPDSGFVELEAGAAVKNSSGEPVPGVRRWLYAGPMGITSGQYGVFGSILSVVEDDGGGRAVRRLQVFQESFAKFAYFTDVEPSNISFGGGDQIFGPVHTNDYLKIYSSGATFHNEARTAKTVQGAAYGTFKKGYEEDVTPIAMPETAELVKLKAQASAGGTSFTGTILGGNGSATTRIEFMAIDLNGDGDATDANEGFLRVYQSNDLDWMSADVSGRDLRASRNCGHYHPGGTFVAAADHPRRGGDNWVASLTNATRRCFLGGADTLSNGFVAADGTGLWLEWSGTVSPLVAGRDDARYLFPISRELNPDFKGVVFVDGHVIVSGRVRGSVTLAATGEIILGDDVTYATDPGLGTCEDILGIFSGTNVVVADNTLNAPVRPSRGQSYFTYDDTKDEFIHGVVLALGIFTVENYAGGSTRDEACEGQRWGRGCLYLTGGIIQTTRGAVGTIRWVGGTGYVKRYSYDSCAAKQPPPYFPTTGHFARGQQYPVDPVGFSAARFYETFQAN